MEFIVNNSQFEKMIDNTIKGFPKMINSKINFRGKNNILVCENDIILDNIVLNFNGDDSIVYLGSNLKNNFRLNIYNNSSIFLGKNIDVGVSITIEALEGQNIIIGDDCVLGNNVYISNSDGYSFYDTNSKNRINFSKSIFIGDHVLLGNNVFISKGVKIGSGSIVDNMSFIPAYAKVGSNLYLSGNPAKIIRKNIFFSKDHVGNFKNTDTENFKFYKSDVFIFNVVDQETLSLDDIDRILKELDVNSKQEFIQKLFIINKRKNRFSI
ncbi:acyltransferase [Methanobrevibacter sp.]|uniref:acyltransferase n=1 Tax=Methanobrevibacter sp. TaxID=66852 RepID=UPI00386AF9C1